MLANRNVFIAFECHLSPVLFARTLEFAVWRFVFTLERPKTAQNHVQGWFKMV